MGPDRRDSSWSRRDLPEFPTEAEGSVTVAGPDACSETEVGVVGDGQCFVIVP